MPLNSFTITTTTSKIQLSDQRQGKVVFTVTNSTDKTVVGRANVAVDNPVAENWVSVAGAIEREFTPNATEQVAVQIAAPKDAPLGTYGVSLQMIGVENPDEDFTQGPSVTFEVEPLPKPEPKKFPWWIVAVVVGVLLLAVIAFFVVRALRAPEDFSLFDAAPSARWSSGAGDLPFGGSQGDNRGFVVYVRRTVFENNRTYTALETHPQWVDNGFIRGVYRVPRIQKGQHLLAQIGFIKRLGMPRPNYFIVTIRVNNVTVFREPELYDGRLRSIDIDLSNFSGKSVTIELDVNAKGSSGQDWLGWINPRIASIE